MDLAAARALEEAGIHPDAVAGFSLGEVAAMTFAGGFTDADGFAFVCYRAECMDYAAQCIPSGMVAVLKLDNETVEKICQEFVKVYPVNYNCPGQLVAACCKAELESFCSRVKEPQGQVGAAGGQRGLPLPVLWTAPSRSSRLLWASITCTRQNPGLCQHRPHSAIRSRTRPAPRS